MAAAVAALPSVLPRCRELVESAHPATPTAALLLAILGTRSINICCGVRLQIRSMQKTSYLHWDSVAGSTACLLVLIGSAMMIWRWQQVESL